MKHLLIILIIFFLFIPAFPQNQPDPPEAKTRITVLAIWGNYFLLCVDGYKVFSIIHINHSSLLLLPGKCECESLEEEPIPEKEKEL